MDLPEWDINKDWETILGCDTVFCLEVFEYVYDPATAMRNLSNIMSDGGILYVSFPFIYPIHNPVEMDYLRYTKQGVMTLMKLNGFKIDEMRSRVATEGDAALQAFFSSEGMRKAKQYRGHNEIGYLVKAIKE